MQPHRFLTLSVYKVSGIIINNAALSIFRGRITQGVVFSVHSYDVVLIALDRHKGVFSILKCQLYY